MAHSDCLASRVGPCSPAPVCACPRPPASRCVTPALRPMAPVCLLIGAIAAHALRRTPDADAAGGLGALARLVRNVGNDGRAARQRAAGRRRRKHRPCRHGATGPGSLPSGGAGAGRGGGGSRRRHAAAGRVASDGAGSRTSVGRVGGDGASRLCCRGEPASAAVGGAAPLSPAIFTWPRVDVKIASEFIARSGGGGGAAAASPAALPAAGRRRSPPQARRQTLGRRPHRMSRLPRRPQPRGPNMMQFRRAARERVNNNAAVCRRRAFRSGGGVVKIMLANHNRPASIIYSCVRQRQGSSRPLPRRGRAAA